MQRRINHARKVESKKMYSNSQQFENHHCNSRVLTCRGMHANPGIDAWKGGTVCIYPGGLWGVLQKILMPRELLVQSEA